jgi:ribosome silencing factor RsfS/YbeB/iojap
MTPRSKTATKTARKSGSAQRKVAAAPKVKAVGKAAKASTKASTKARAKAPAVQRTPQRASRKPQAAAAKPPTTLAGIVAAALDDMKAVNPTVIDVRGLTDIADTLVVASGNSDRHVRSIADRVIEYAKKAGHRPVGVEGERDGEWVLVDLQDVIVHIMLPRVREFYRLEDLWNVSAAARTL